MTDRDQTAVVPQRPNGVLALRPPWLSGWVPAHRVPVRRTEVQAQLSQWEATIQPADPRAVAVMLDETIALWPVPENWAEIAKFYLEVLEDVPLDLVQTAFREVRASCKFFPKPAEIRAPIADELRRRKSVVQGLRTALQVGVFDDPA